MTEREHAKLSPSASERWLQCPASIRMEASVPPEPESAYAHEGTAAHALAEIEARARFAVEPGYQDRIQEWLRAYPEADETEMMRHVEAYLDLVEERRAAYPLSQVMFEQRLDTGVPTCWGTSDTVIVSPQHVEIIDFKYGAGVKVEAESNPQLRLYALGALDTYGDLLGETQMVYMTIYQPRIDGHTLTAAMTPDELRAWRTSILPIAELALSDDAPFGPSDQACRWCPASGRCRAQLEDIFREDFESLPETLTPEDVADTLPKLPKIREWLKKFEEAALAMAYSEGTPIPGWKVVMSGGQRYFADEDGAMTLLHNVLGYDLDEISRRKILGIGAMEKLLGKEGFSTTMAPFVQKTSGKPSLVVEEDRRQPVSPNTEAIKAFREHEGEPA